MVVTKSGRWWAAHWEVAGEGCKVEASTPAIFEEARRKYRDVVQGDEPDLEASQGRRRDGWDGIHDEPARQRDRMECCCCIAKIPPPRPASNSPSSSPCTRL